MSRFKYLGCAVTVSYTDLDVYKRQVTSKYVLSTGLASSCVLLLSNVLKFPNTPYLLCDHVERMNQDERAL